MTLRCDTLVVGGGPAGTAAAVTLARRGHDVTLIERTRCDRPRFGQSVPPQIRAPLCALGAWDRFLEGSPVPSPGTLASWADAGVHENDHIANPYGDAWHIDRRRFDEGLMQTAVRAGVRVRLGEGLDGRPERRHGSWRIPVSAATTRTATVIEARHLVDASGRNAELCTRLGWRRTFHDRLIGVVQVFRDSPPDRDPRGLVEAGRDGWWYSAPMPHGRLLAAYMTDADLLPAPRRAVELCQQLLRDTPLTQARLRRAQRPADVQIESARTSRLEQVARAGCVAVGDAALTFDPLSSAGVTFALQSGRRAAEAMADADDGDPAATDRYTAWIRATFERFLRDRSVYYSQVRRWPQSPFWARRVTEPVRDNEKG